MFSNVCGGSKINLNVETLNRNANQDVSGVNNATCITKQEDFKLGEDIIMKIEVEESNYEEEILQFKENTLTEKLGVWYYKNRPSRESFEELLCILREENLNVPESATSFEINKEPLFFKEGFLGLTESVNQLKGTIEELAATSIQQNTIIIEALNTQKVLTEKLLGKEKNEAKVRKIFPIQTVDDLTETNNKITEANRAVYIRVMLSLLNGQLRKYLKEIFSVDLIVAINIDGIHGKLPLRNFKKFFAALMDAIRDGGEQNPEQALRNAFKKIKRRHFQTICNNKKKDTKVSNDHQEATFSNNLYENNII